MTYIPYIARLDTIDEELTDDHLRQDFLVEEYADEWSRGQVTRAHITIPNPGLALLAPDQKQFVAVFESPDGTIASARMLLRGRIMPVLRTGTDVENRMISLEIIAAPADMQGEIFSYASANLRSGPEFDYLFADLSFDKPQEGLDGRSATLYVDPVTHEVSLEDIIDSTLDLIDLDSNTDYKSHKLTFGEPPVQRAKLQVQCEWTQYAYTPVNIASVVTDPSGSITTLDAEHFEYQQNSLPTNFVDFVAGSGWKKDKDQVFGVQYQTQYIQTGRLWQYQYQNNALDPVTFLRIDNGTYTAVHTEYAAFYVTSYQYVYHWMIADYKQQRRETATLFVDYDLQNIIGVEPEVDLGTLRLKDLFTWEIPNSVPPPEPDEFGNYTLPYSGTIVVKPWTYETIYNTGDIVTFGNRAYRCINDNTVGPFYHISGISFSIPNFVQIDYESPMPDTRCPSFFDLGRGQQALEHAMLRCRAFLRARSQCITAEFECDWETGIGISGQNEVRFTTYDYAAGVGRAVRGKVRNLKRKINKDRKIITVQLGVCVGTGVTVTVPQVGPTVYSGTTLASDYYNNVTSTLGLPPGTVAAELASIYSFNTHYPQQLLGSFGFQDVAWTYGAQDLLIPVDAFRLGDPNYAVFSVTRTNQAPVQLAIAISYGNRQRDPRDAIRNWPTSIQVVMRNLNAAGVIERLYDVAAQVCTSPRGIDLVAGDEP